MCSDGYEKFYGEEGQVIKGAIDSSRRNFFKVNFLASLATWFVHGSLLGGPFDQHDKNDSSDDFFVL